MTSKKDPYTVTTETPPTARVEYPWERIDEAADKAMQIRGADEFKRAQRAAHIRGKRLGMRYQTEKTPKGGKIWRVE